MKINAYSIAVSLPRSDCSDKKSSPAIRLLAAQLVPERDGRRPESNTAARLSLKSRVVGSSPAITLVLWKTCGPAQPLLSAGPPFCPEWTETGHGLQARELKSPILALRS